MYVFDGDPDVDDDGQPIEIESNEIGIEQIIEYFLKR